MANIFILAKGLKMGARLIGVAANPSFLTYRLQVNTDSTFGIRTGTESIHRMRVNTDPVQKLRIRARN